jgi:hypothetical protein
MNNQKVVVVDVQSNKDVVVALESKVVVVNLKVHLAVDVQRSKDVVDAPVNKVAVVVVVVKNVLL